MTSEARAQLQEAIDLLDEVLDADDLTGEEWHEVNEAYHKLESVLDEA
jgi:DNA-binding GntR family transcriptional regulator